MIICIEGPRNSGKTHLLREFNLKYGDKFKQHMFKFKMVSYIELLPNISLYENTPIFHYFNLSPFLSLLEFDKADTTPIISDRGLLSGYVWSILRNRITQDVADAEIQSIVSSDLYQNVHNIYIERAPTLNFNINEKDWWSQFENYKQENELFNHYLNILNPIFEKKSNCSFTRIYNHFNDVSCNNFSELLLKIMHND